ncbi:MAG TPA: ATP-binding protein [Gemmatimonadaceae bacterium]|nr:ATP-binding protein [Gemmatimonadaceae bacterium]
MLSTDLSEHALLDALPISVYALDLGGHLTTVRQAAPRFGEDAGALTVTTGDGRGTPIWDAMRDTMSRDQIEHAMRLLRTGRAPVVQWEIERGPDDHVLLAQMTPLHDDARAVTGFVVCTVDITSRDHVREAVFDSGIALARTIETDEAYHEAAQQLRRTLRADVVIVAVSDDHDAPLRIVFDVGSDDDRRSLEQRFGRTWQSVLETGRVVASRDAASVALTAALLGETRPLGVISIIVDDIESPEQLGDARRFLAAVASQLSSAIDRARHVAHAGRRHRSGAIGEVASGVAQELRNPIFGISSAAQLLRFRAREDPVMETNVGRILREVERLNRMVGTLVELGRPIVLNLGLADPDSIWAKVLESERGRLESRAIAIRLTRPDVPATIAVDAEQLAQAFKSILSNAVDAAPVATDISVQSTLLPTGGWRTRITNGGAPIPAEMLPRVFEPFLSTKPGSSGVGLALAQRIIEEHQGTITIESSAEKGTSVVVTLPGAPRTATLT